MIEEFLEDACDAIRAMRRDPWLATVITATLCLAIGASTAVFSIADSILIRPLPYPHSGRIDWISEITGPAREDVGAAPDYYVIREQNRIFEDVAAFNPLTRTWTGIENPFYGRC